MHPYINTTSPSNEFQQNENKRLLLVPSVFSYLCFLYLSMVTYVKLLCVEISWQCSIIWFCLAKVYSALFRSSKGKENTKGTIEYFNRTKNVIKKRKKENNCLWFTKVWCKTRKTQQEIWSSHGKKLHEKTKIHHWLSGRLSILQISVISPLKLTT